MARRLSNFMYLKGCTSFCKRLCCSSSLAAGLGVGHRIAELDEEAQLADDLAQEIMGDYLIGDFWFDLAYSFLECTHLVLIPFWYSIKIA